MSWRQFKAPLEGKKVDKVEKPPEPPPLSTFSTLFPAEEDLKISEIFTELDRLGSWEGVRTKAATACPDLLTAAKIADKELDEAPEDRQTLERYFNCWRAVWLACQSSLKIAVSCARKRGPEVMKSYGYST